MILRVAVSILMLLLCVSCAVAHDPIGRIDQSLRAAAKYLAQRQDADGAWRSGVHGSFRGGPSLTAHVLSTLFFIANDDGTRASFRRGSQYLTTLALQGDEPALHFPVYTASEASWVAVLEGRTGPGLRVEAFWLEYLKQRQLNAALGWDEQDPEFGGWGYSPIIPRKPQPGQAKHPLVSSNLSATVFALGALRSGKVPPGDRAYHDALIFVLRCQNFDDDPQKRDTRFDDGGFFFQPGDAATNKAGVAGVDRAGHTRFNSYGSMTCDGIRAMLACGLPTDHPRVVAAKQWMQKNFSVSENPGRFAADRQAIRNATYYYHCWSLAHAMRRLGVGELDTPNGRVNWAEALADELMRRQRPDGSWENELNDAKEDDPLVSTSFAAAALAICREQIRAMR
jgi:squalene-hopene/tetraprenyl-beta-curcumene cyclase